jgi:hypothetical protein
MEPGGWQRTHFAANLILPILGLYFCDEFHREWFDAILQRLALLIRPLYLLLNRCKVEVEMAVPILVEWCDDWWYYHGDLVEVVALMAVKTLFVLFVLVMVLAAVVLRQPDNTRWMSDKNEMSPWAVAEEAKAGFEVEVEAEAEKPGGRESVRTSRYMFS